MSLAVVVGARPAMAGDDGDDGDPAINASWEFARANRLASAGAVTRSIPHYEKVLKAAPREYPQAYFNLAGVYRFKHKCRTAVLLYSAYMTIVANDQAEADADKGIARCMSSTQLGTLTVAVSPQSKARLVVEDYLVAVNGGVDKLRVAPGTYSVEVMADEHVPETREVTVEESQTTEVEYKLQKKLFYGAALIDVDQRKATVELTPKDLDSPKASSEAVTLSSPMDAPHELATGTYFLEVTKDGYHRWIRNIHIERDKTATVHVEMSEALPAAIRPD